MKYSKGMRVKTIFGGKYGWDIEFCQEIDAFVKNVEESEGEILGIEPGFTGGSYRDDSKKCMFIWYRKKKTKK